MHKKILISLLLSAAALGATAQDLHKEITVERTVQPDLRDAFRLGGIAPEITMPPITTRTLRPAEYTDAGAFTSEAATLPPAPWADSIPMSPYRVYVSAGYLPMYNAAGSGGLEIIRRPTARLGIWAQADAYSYTGDIPYSDDVRLGTIVTQGGLDGSFRLPDRSVVTCALRGMAAAIRTPFSYFSKSLPRTSVYYQRAMSIGASLGWEKQFGTISGALGLGWENFRFLHNLPPEVITSYTAANEKLWTINGAVGLSDEYTGTRWLGINIDWNVLSSNAFPTQWYTSEGTITEGHIRPYLNFDSDAVHGSVGMNLSVATGHDDGGMKIAPEANIALDVTDSFVVWAKATGGEKLNPLSDVFRISQYVSPILSYGRTNVPFDIRGGFNYGPSSGLSIEVNGGYAKVRDMLTPMVTIYSNGYMNSRFAGSDFGCWYVGGRVSYAYGQLFTMALGLKTGAADNEVNSWYEWYDGAKLRFDASLKVHPIDNLDVELGYVMATDRKGITDVHPYGIVSSQVQRYKSNLGNIGSLNLNASYTINSNFTAFLALDNILAKKYLLVSGMPARRLGGLMGIAFKF